MVSAYVYKGDYYRAAVLLEHLATDPASTPDQARQAAAFAMAIYRDLFNSNRNNPQVAAADLNRFRSLAELIVKKWPKEKEADEARYWLGFLYVASGRFREAAELWEAVSPNSPHYAQACAEAGELYFKLHVTERRKENQPLSNPSPDSDKALKLLQTSLAAFEKQKIPPDSPAANRYIQAAVFLADAYALLNKPDEVLKTLAPFLERAVKNPATLPEGTTGRIITLALRAQVQLKRMDEARKLLQELYRAGTQQELGQGVLPILREMGAQLAEQIRRLERQGPAAEKELEQTKRSFKQFLDDISKDPKLPSEFRIWLITSYQSVGDFETAAKQASALREEFSKLLQAGPPTGEAAKNVEEAQRLFQQVLYLEVDSLRKHARQVLKQKGAAEAAPLFQQAHKLLEGGMKQAKLEKHPSFIALRLLLLQDEERYSGPRGAIAGWDNLRSALQPHLERGGVVRSVYLDACYNLVYCKYQEARRLPDEKAKERALRSTAELLASFWGEPELQTRFQEFLGDPDTKELLPYWEEVRKGRGL
jgi:tetratricopeptide (TPR) repeat protein